MAMLKFSPPLSTRNRNEEIMVFLDRACSMLDVIMKANPYDLDAHTLHDYYWAIYDTLDSAKSAVEDI